jgi:hypothetical protein
MLMSVGSEQQFMGHSLSVQDPAILTLSQNPTKKFPFYLVTLDFLFEVT